MNLVVNHRQLSEIKYVKAELEHVEHSEFPEKVFLCATFLLHPKG